MEQKQLSLFDQTEQPSHYFERKRSWSAAKHRIMLRYIQSFCYTLGGSKNFQSPVLNYVDGFAGQGTYKEGIGIQDFVKNSNFWKKHQSRFKDTDGSPLIALKCSQIFQEEDRVKLRCFFVEKKRNFHKELTQNCSDIEGKTEFKIYPPQSFEKAIDQILVDLQGYPTLFFLDVFGVKGVPFQKIQQISQYLSQNRGEMFILFHNSSVSRQAGYLTGQQSDSQGRSPNRAMMNNITNLLGENSEGNWTSKWRELKDKPQEFEQWALSYFKNQILKLTHFKGVTSFPVLEKYNDSRPQYHIVVASNHPDKAFGEFLNDFIWHEERILFFDKENKLTDFFEREWNKKQQARVNEIQFLLSQVLSEQITWIAVDNLITQVILKSQQVGLISRSHYRQLIIDLYNQKAIRAKSIGPRGLTLNSLVKLQ